MDEKKRSENKGIDKDIIDIITRDFEGVCLTSNAEMNRVIFNSFAEELTVLRDIVNFFETQNNFLSIIFQDEIAQYIMEVGKNAKIKE